MKKNNLSKHFLSLASALLLVLLCCACSGGTDVPSDTNLQTDSSAAEDTTDSTTEIPDVYIHAFSELNTKEHSPDSHKDVWDKSCLEENARDYNTYEGIAALGINGYYPRVKKLNDGRYMLIFHNGDYGGSVYVAFASDIGRFSAPTEIFGSVQLDGETKLYMTPDAVQMPNGRIIAVCSYRSSSSYSSDIGKNGIAVRYSDDGGKTWSEQKTVYKGTNWEPSLLSTGTEEVKLMFTSTAQSVELYGFDNRYGVVGMLSSADNGATWTPNVTESPWAAQIIAQRYLGMEDGMLRMTDQMPVATVLNNGTTVLAVEEQINQKSGNTVDKIFSLGFAYSKNAFADVSLKIDQPGPADAIHNAFSGAGPYIRQFLSGETVLTYHWSGTFYYRLGDSSAKTWRTQTDVFDKAGHWGSVEVDGSHSCVMTIGKQTYGLYLTRLYLNHKINAQKSTPVLDGNGNDWTADEAWFVGSDSQAQCSIRFAHDDEKIYILAERLDEYIESSDSISVIIDDGTQGGFYTIKVAPDTKLSATKYDPGTKRFSNIDCTADVSASVSVCGTVSDPSDKDKGVVYEIAINKTYANAQGSDLAVNISMQNRDKASGKLITDTIDGTDVADKSTWIPVSLG